MLMENAEFVILITRPKAEKDREELQQSSLAKKNLSVVGKGYHTADHITSHVNFGSKRGIGWRGLNGSMLCILLLVNFMATTIASEAPVKLGSAVDYAVLASSTVTNVNSVGTTVTGDIGVSPGTAVLGFPPGIVNGRIHAGDVAAAQAQSDVTTAYNDAAGRSTAPITVAGNLGGMTLYPGLYKSTSSLAVSSGDLTLDAQGDSNAVFIFQAASTLTTTSGRQVILRGGANASNIFWQVGSSATFGTGSVFKGTILAYASITFNTGATLEGRALAKNGAVTLDSNNIVSGILHVLSVNEFDKASLADDGWVVIPGGFESAPPGTIVKELALSEKIPSSKDGKGLLFTVQPGQVVFAYSQQAISTGGGPVLLRLSVRATSAGASLALAALRGSFLDPILLDGSIGMNFPQSTKAMTDREYRLVLLYEPDQGNVINPVIQFASNSKTETVSVYVDKLELFNFDPDFAKTFNSIP